MREHQVTLTTNECAALLAAAKSILDAYDRNPERASDAQTDLQSAVQAVAAGMGLSGEKAADLLQFMDTGTIPPRWNNLFS